MQFLKNVVKFVVWVSLFRFTEAHTKNKMCILFLLTGHQQGHRTSNNQCGHEVSQCVCCVSVIGVNDKQIVIVNWTCPQLSATLNQCRFVHFVPNPRAATIASNHINSPPSSQLLDQYDALFETPRDNSNRLVVECLLSVL